MRQGHVVRDRGYRVLLDVRQTPQRWYGRAGLVAAVHLAQRLVRTSSDLFIALAVHKLRGSERHARDTAVRPAASACNTAVAAAVRYILVALDVWLQPPELDSIPTCHNHFAHREIIAMYW